MIQPARPKSGFTLLELVIVLAILTSLVAMAWPKVRRQLQRSLPHEAALQLKAEFADARQEAIRSGQAWVCRCQMASGRYQLGPAAELVSREEYGPSAEFAADGTDASLPFRELPKGVVFWQSVATLDLPLAEPFTEQETDTLTDAPWITAAEFQPDGRATETVIELICPDTLDRIQLHLRGLTGAVKIGAVERMSHE